MACVAGGQCGRVYRRLATARVPQQPEVPAAVTEDAERLRVVPQEPVPDGGGGNHSIFAKLLIDFLKENNREITISEISSKITQQVITNSEQTPELAPMHKSGHDGGEFIFVPSI